MAASTILRWCAASDGQANSESGCDRARGGVPWVTLSLELQPVNEPAAPYNERSDIRMNHEFPIGAWAAFAPETTGPSVAETSNTDFQTANNWSTQRSAQASTRPRDANPPRPFLSK